MSAKQYNNSYYFHSTVAYRYVYMYVHILCLFKYTHTRPHMCTQMFKEYSHYYIDFLAKKKSQNKEQKRKNLFFSEFFSVFFLILISHINLEKKKFFIFLIIFSRDDFFPLFIKFHLISVYLKFFFF